MQTETHYPANPIAKDGVPFNEEVGVKLSDRDRDLLLELLANPPASTPALLAAATRCKDRIRD